MREPSLTRIYLETLTTGDLVKLADSRGIDIPPELERVFAIEKLLESGAEETAGEDTPCAPVRRHFSGTAALPGQYNISYIEVMIRDPLWAFVFWEINKRDREHYEAASDFSGYCLRVRQNRTEDVFFTVPVGRDDASWYLNFQPCSGECKVDFCALLGEAPALITSSAPFSLPELLEPSNRKELPADLAQIYRNPLALLSGAEIFPVMRNTSRLPRIKAADAHQGG